MSPSHRLAAVVSFAALVVGVGLLGAQDFLVSRPAAIAKPAPTAKVGDVLATGKGETRRVLVDGGVVLLNESTKVRYADARSLVVEAGEAVIDAGESGLTVGILGESLKVRNARFAVRLAPTPILFALRGQIAGDGKAGPFTLMSGQQRENGRVAPTTNVAQLLAWTQPLVDESPLVPASQHVGGRLIATDPTGQDAKIALRAMHVDVHIEDGFARTTIDQTFFNSESFPLEGTFIFPLPADASLSRLAMYVDGVLREGSMVERDRARDIYERIRYANRDPALLEWVDGTTFKMRVFPLEPRTEKRILISYVQRLPVVFGQATYRFPAGQRADTIDRWSFTSHVVGGAEMTWRCPSHDLQATKSGGDLTLVAATKKDRADRDIVLELVEAKDVPPLRASIYEEDGSRYLMVRYRPSIDTPRPTGKRHWAFLFESSGDRDPLLARTQIEIIRGLLQQLDPADTFSVYAAGTRVKEYTARPRTPTPDSIKLAMEFLESSHLVGAFDLGKALEAIPNPSGGPAQLFHVGSGHAALGERRPGELVKKIAPGMSYVGIGVGRRWDRAFFKTAAEKTAGWFTQVNPDESIPWRALEIATALKSQRWLDVSVEALDGATEGDPIGDAPKTELPKFVTLTNSVLEGEEIVAITRVGPRPGSTRKDLPFALPRHVAFRAASGTTHVSDVKKVKGARPDAAYLPRMWAKLEIDRLVAGNPVKNRAAIVDLSRSLFVMSPFTSLLVLENDDMIAQYRIEGGRKDHWAKYPAPDKIEVVVEPEPGQPDPRLAGKKQPARDVARSVLVRGTSLARPNMIALNGQTVEFAGVSDLGVGFDSSPRKTSNIGGFVFDPDSAVIIATDGVAQAPGQIEVLERIIGNKKSVQGQSRGARRDIDELLRPMSSSNNPQEPAFDSLIGVKEKFEKYGKYERLVERWGRLPPLEQSRALAERQFLEMMPKSVDGAEGRDRDVQNDDPEILMQLKMMDRAMSRSDRPDRFTDLIRLAPGMNSSRADALAVIEAEAQPTPMSRVGKIALGVRELFDKARTGGWRRWSVDGDVITFDPAGRFVRERVLPSGIRERVECDGAALVHLYPELHVGARRVVSRFHRLELANRIPWMVPIADDLARGADLRLLDARTVAVVPHGSERPGVDALETHYVFDGTRISEIQYVSSAKRTILAREVLDPAGSVLFRAGDGKDFPIQRGKLESATAPTFTTDLKDLVVLPLPYRPAEHVVKQLKLEKKTADQYSLAEALPVFAAHFGAGDGEAAANVFRRTFVAREQKPLGMYVLLAALGQNLDSEHLDVAGEYPDVPLAQYLALHTSPVLRKHASQWAVQSATWDGYLGRMSLAHALLQRWSDPRVEKLAPASLKLERAKALAFVLKNRDSEYGWDVLTRMQARTPAADKEFQRELAAAFESFKDRPGLGYSARYEAARCLWRAGDTAKAGAKFVSTYNELREKVGVPPIDADFRAALEASGVWPKTIATTATRLLANKNRGAILALAWQIWQLEDPILANDVAAQALAGVADGAEKTKLQRMMLDYLWKTDQVVAGDELLEKILGEPENRDRPEFWRVGHKFAEHRGQSARALECLERALEAEFRALPEVVNLSEVDNEYGNLLSTYRQLAESMRTLKMPAPLGFATKTIRTADRWRLLNPGADKASTETAAILRILGDKEQAWEYETTPLARNPHGSDAWHNLAKSLVAVGDGELADAAYAAAFDAEPTDPRLLWDRAENLRRLGRTVAAADVVRRIAEGQWQPRFQGLVSQAKARTQQ